MQNVYNSGSLGSYGVSKVQYSAYAAGDEEDEDSSGIPKLAIVFMIVAAVLIAFGLGLFIINVSTKKVNNAL